MVNLVTRLTVILCLLLAVCAKRVDWELIAAEQNADPKRTWEAKLSKNLDFDDDEALKALLGTFLEPEEEVAEKIKKLKERGEI